MKLLACHVENFGKLSNLRMEFHEGVNVINEQNGWGKSTLAAFLKVMFYGLDAKKSEKAFEKERIFYCPWQGGSFGGEVDFEVNGKQYRISRSFGRTEKTDQFHLYDLSTNLESHDYTSNIGVELFDLDSNSFKRSIYIAQNDCESVTSDGIHAKIGNLSGSANDMSSYESASAHLKEMMNRMTPDRATGSLKKRKSQITHLSQELHTLNAAQDGYNGILEMKNPTDAQMEELLSVRQNYRGALTEASEDSRKQELLKQYGALCKDVKEKEERVNSFYFQYPNGFPERQEIEDQIQSGRIMEELHTSMQHYAFSEEEQKQWDKLDDMFHDGKPDLEAIDAAIQSVADTENLREEMIKLQNTYHDKVLELKEMEEKQNRGKRFSGIKLFLLMLTLFVLTIGTTVLISYYNPMHLNETQMVSFLGLANIGMGFIILLIGLILLLGGRKKRKQLDESIEAARAEAIELSQNMKAIKQSTKEVLITISKFLGKYRVFCDTNSYSTKLYDLKTQLMDYERLVEKNNAFEAMKEKHEAMKAHIEAFAKKYAISFTDDIISDLNQLENKAIELRLAKETLEESIKKRQKFEEERDQSFWTKTAPCPYGVEELNQLIAQADKRIEELQETEKQYQKQLDELQAQLDIRDEKAAELEGLLREQEEETEKYHLIKTTHEFLQKAKEQFISRYMVAISKNFGKYYYMLTGDNRSEWVLDANMNLKLREFGELRDIHYLSLGYQDLIGVCMRLALVDAMYKEEKPFLILDDPFMNLDDKKVKRGNQFLVAVGEEYQVIYFTCHESRSPI